MVTHRITHRSDSWVEYTVPVAYGVCDMSCPRIFCDKSQTDKALVLRLNYSIILIKKNKSVYKYVLCEYI